MDPKKILILILIFGFALGVFVPEIKKLIKAIKCSIFGKKEN